MNKLEGESMHNLKRLLIIVPFILSGCSSLKLAPADFSWPVESVIHVDNKGMAVDDRYSISFSAKPLFLEETGDSLGFVNKDLRVIRDTLGYYYITSNNFKNVYVFTMGEGSFNLEEKIQISENGITNPVFNQRPPYIELVDGDKQYYLSNNGIENKEK
jgi:hypothetical protein